MRIRCAHCNVLQVNCQVNFRILELQVSCQLLQTCNNDVDMTDGMSTDTGCIGEHSEQTSALRPELSVLIHPLSYRESTDLYSCVVF